ncbi:MAG: putative Fe-S oxidoreductase [Elusimicrobia bacterium]|nr:MAG: putative Fe-S oxidoreductase [Elusimicrobiota bacterium]KAF0157972.1 MAG: putative Fe-S oxidoreductase [Elusimicrobiota bacterium]
MDIREAARKFGWPKSRMKVCELTLNYACNARCVFCYSSPDMEEWKGKDDMRYRQAADYLMFSYRNGARMVQFIGGEPTIYPELPKLVRLAKKIGYPAIQVISNGINLGDRAYASELAACGMNTASISIHGDNAAMHDAVTGIKGSFKKAVRACGNLLDLGVYLNINTAITALNYRQLPAFTGFALDNFRTDSVHLIAAHFTGAAGRSPEKLIVRYSLQAPYLREAIAAFGRRRVRPAFRFLSNYVPCLLPEHANLMKDWELPDRDDDLFLPEEKHVGRMYAMVTDKLRAKAETCSRCVYNGVCAGFEKNYAAHFGRGEFRPVSGKRTIFAVRPVHG